MLNKTTELLLNGTTELLENDNIVNINIVNLVFTFIWIPILGITCFALVIYIKKRQRRRRLFPHDTDNISGEISDNSESEV